jgi:hypothetical protein
VRQDMAALCRGGRGKQEKRRLAQWRRRGHGDGWRMHRINKKDNVFIESHKMEATGADGKPEGTARGRRGDGGKDVATLCKGEGMW